MKIVIIRHGDPDYVKDSLTPKGWREATLLSDRISMLDVKAFYCSPLGRAKDTASLTLEKMNRKATELDWLREFEGKIRKGLKISSCWDRKPLEWTLDDNYYRNETWYKTKLMRSLNAEKEYKRVCSGIDELLKKHGYEHSDRYYKVSNSNHDTIVLFCHFAVECVILSHILSCSPMVLWHNFVALPTSVTTLVTEEREKGIAVFRCQQFGDISHLYAGGEEPAFAARFCECFDDDTRH
ncbi:MAG: histidine phosphatase family protein [Eubacterium sp.]|nr:histidine phosphatase family protein [Eubacterium sp.]MDE6155859.1 histidine phosphatase family protein [Eubacterium sp.]